MKPVDLQRWAADGEAAVATAGCSAAPQLKRGKHVCRGNQRDGGLTMRACQRTAPAHKHGDYASESEGRVTDDQTILEPHQK